MGVARLIMDYYTEQDRQVERSNVERRAIRERNLPAAEVRKQGGQLYAVVVSQIKDKPGMTEVVVRCPCGPHSVFAHVLRGLRERGWQARHAFCDDDHQYDMIIASPPEENSCP